MFNNSASVPTLENRPDCWATGAAYDELDNLSEEKSTYQPESTAQDERVECEPETNAI